MQIIKLYKYKRADGGTSVSPVKPPVYSTEMVRLVANEGKALTRDGIHLVDSVDAYAEGGWYEVEKPKEDEE